MDLHCIAISMAKKVEKRSCHVCGAIAIDCLFTTLSFNFLATWGPFVSFEALASQKYLRSFAFRGLLAFVSEEVCESVSE